MKRSISSFCACWKNAICTGYANRFNMLMHEMGIPSIMITGNIASWRSVKHAWNLVEIDGKWYHVDTISDRVDLTKGKAKDRVDSHKVTYNYF
ncbi:transglutaminase domain-containing protein [Mycoplasmopsis bovis]|nr:transglutaminase domain-containing protein [Mycoplasmopsis bovis]WNW00543.1 transglutaminase domain-containing protein [Mycoplasmopsis bovis]